MAILIFGILDSSYIVTAFNVLWSHNVVHKLWSCCL